MSSKLSCSPLSWILHCFSFCSSCFLWAGSLGCSPAGWISGRSWSWLTLPSFSGSPWLMQDGLSGVYLCWVFWATTHGFFSPPSLGQETWGIWSLPYASAEPSKKSEDESKRSRNVKDDWERRNGEEPTAIKTTLENGRSGKKRLLISEDKKTENDLRNMHGRNRGKKSVSKASLRHSRKADNDPAPKGTSNKGREPSPIPQEALRVPTTPGTCTCRPLGWSLGDSIPGRRSRKHLERPQSAPILIWAESLESLRPWRRLRSGF